MDIEYMNQLTEDLIKKLLSQKLTAKDKKFMIALVELGAEHEIHPLHFLAVITIVAWEMKRQIDSGKHPLPTAGQDIDTSTFN